MEQLPKAITERKSNQEETRKKGKIVIKCSLERFKKSGNTIVYKRNKFIRTHYMDILVKI